MKKSRLAALRAVLAAGVCILLTGCFDTKQEILLNPDGSGKAVMESTFIALGSLFDGTESSSGKGAQEQVRKLIQDAQGVEAWRDVSFRETEDGRVTFRGTAYFSDLANLKVGIAPFLRFAATKDATEQLTITRIVDPTGSPYPFQQTNEPVTAESIQRERQQFRAGQPLLAATFGSMKQDTVFRVPGVVRRASNFETNTAGTLRIQLDGARLVRVIEEFLFDAEFARQRLSGSASVNLLTNSFAANERLFGQKAPVLALIQPGRKPLFDYATEVAEAREAFPGIVAALGLTKAQTTKPAVDGAPAGVKVVGMGWQFEPVSARNRRLDGSRRGYTLTLAAELPGRVFSVNSVQVTRAISVEGASLLPTMRSSYALSLPRQEEGWTNVRFDVHLAAPAADCKGIAEVSGLLECGSAENQRIVDLISGTLRNGAKGTEFGAQIDEIRPDVAGGGKLVLRTRLAPEQIRSVQVVSDAGQIVKLEKRSSMAIGEDRTYTYVSAHPIPHSGRIVAAVMVGSKTVWIPFSVTNLTLLGQPLAAR